MNTRRIPSIAIALLSAVAISQLAHASIASREIVRPIADSSLGADRGSEAVAAEPVVRTVAPAPVRVEPERAPAYLRTSLSARDCREGADFIRNAALSRDAGLSATQFFARFEQDLIVVMGMRPEVRWFVYSEREAALLRGAANAVFGEPRRADSHAARFLSVCDAYRRASGERMLRTGAPGSR